MSIRSIYCDNSAARAVVRGLDFLWEGVAFHIFSLFRKRLDMD